MHFLEAEGGWSLSFAGSGFLGLYHVGATQCLRQRAPRILQGASCFYGSSAGALNAMTIVCGMSTDYSCSNLLGMVKHVERLSLGIFHPAYGPIEQIRKQLQDTLPDNCHILASQRLGISMTRWPDGKNCIVTDFATRDELIQRYIDGALSNNLPFSDSPTTITVSPFYGTADICPQSNSGSLYELTAFNASFQISTKNFFQGFISLFPPKPEVVADYCRQGYLDALRFLERRGLTKEPVLWSLVSKEPPALMEGPRSADYDQDQKLTLTIRWDIPNVLVKDVADFELLSPELEAALRKACQRDFWARFQCSVPGRALTYLLLPCTLPFEYVYFRSRRLLLWLPEMPADLCWMQGLLKSTTREVYSMAKSQLLRLVSPSVTSADSGPRQLRTAASENRALNLRLASRALG
ncbi:patatin-like phospholipase domain-containing protein 5 isoform X2 [Peromyscus californicus insignis]|uniref:patatin-like phospholipase domain-containing protein 5 isoform X2 n=1 Tax=Peromyscus californicus insignis TaxID=564181 RepID=UPI0022A76746|nr:patatin-like phospholipase domain-containing protein 5 isoform X2 [Peromyscus californicus insignis]